MKTESHTRHDAEVNERLISDLRRELLDAKWLVLAYTVVSTAEQQAKAEGMASAWRESVERIGDAA